MRQLIVVLLILTGCSCEDKTKEMIVNPYVFSLGGDTTPDGHQIFGVVGDSNADGRGATIPTVGSGILYLWDGSAFDEITTQSVSNDDNTKGSIWQQFATDYNTNTTYKVDLVNGASGGSEFYPNGDNNNWYTSGTLYAAWKTKMDNALAFRGLSRPKAIFVNLGINDLRSANTFSDIQTGMNSLFSRLTSDYPNVPILCIQLGRDEVGGFNSQDAYDMRLHLINTCESNTNIHIVSSAATFVDVSGGYIADNLHYSQATNDIIGSQFARWFNNSSISNKWARSVVSAHFDELSSNRKTLIADFVTNLYNDGNYFKLEQLSLFKTTTQNNTLFDFTFKGYSVKVSTPSFTANDNLATNGTSTAFTISYINSIYTGGGAGQNDFIIGVKLKTRTTASGSSAVFFGRGDGSSNYIRVAQGATSVNYHANVAAASQKNYATDAAFVNNTLYSVARNGGTEYLLKGSSVVDSNAIASTTAMSGAITIGANNLNGTVSLWFNASYEYCFAAKYSDFDMASFYTDIEYVLTHWND